MLSSAIFAVFEKKEKQSMPQQTKSKPNNTREEKEQER